MIAKNDENKPADSPRTDTGAGGDAARPTPRSDGEAPDERGGPSGPEPTRYGDWERKGRCIDF